MATIRERRPGYWEIRAYTGRTEDGRATQVTRTLRGTKRDAQRLAAELAAKPQPHAAGRTVADAVNAWREVNEPLWAQSTRRDNASRAKLLLDDPIANISLARLSVADVERWHARLRRAGVGEYAVRGRHNALRSAIAQAVRWGWINGNVASNARLRLPRTGVREALTPDEVRAALVAAEDIDPMAVLALRIAAVAGARRSEIAALQWSEVVDGKLTIDSSVEEIRRPDGTKTFVDAPTKTGNRRAVRLDDATLALIDKHRTEHEEASPYMFSIDRDPPPPARIGWWWARARTIAGLDSKWRLHDLRHWSATAAISSGYDVRTVAGRLGHANPAMTLRVYAHAVENADAPLAAHLGEVLDS